MRFIFYVECFHRITCNHLHGLFGAANLSCVLKNNAEDKSCQTAQWNVKTSLLPECKRMFKINTYI